MRINGSNSVQNIEVTNQNETAQPKPASSQVETSMVAPKSANDTRAASKSSESGFGASMIANQLRSSSNQSLGGILSNLSDMMKSSSKNQTPLERAKSVHDDDDNLVGAGPAKGASTTPHLVNNGGKVLSSPAIANIYYGDYFNTTTGKADATFNDNAAKAWVTSGNEGILKQYGVGKGTFAGSDTVAGKVPKTFTEADAQKLVQQQIAAGKSPAGDQTIHTIIVPPGTVISVDGSTSKQGLGGYHGSYTDPNTGKQVYYAVIVNGKGNNGIDFDGNNRDNVSIVESHEWAEASTDPDVDLANSENKTKGVLGWYDNNQGEIGDIAINISQDPNLGDVWAKSSKNGGYAFQDLWSNKDNQEENVVGTKAPTNS